MVELLIPKLIFTILIMPEFDKVHFPEIWKQSKDYLLDNSSDTYLNFYLWGHWIFQRTC